MISEIKANKKATLTLPNVTRTALCKHVLITHENIISSRISTSGYWLLGTCVLLPGARTVTRVSFKTIMLIRNERPPRNNSQLKARASETERNGRVRIVRERDVIIWARSYSCTNPGAGAWTRSTSLINSDASVLNAVIRRY